MASDYCSCRDFAHPPQAQQVMPTKVSQ